jgi:hypothetical protein
MFNTFLEDLKEQLRNKASFWARIKEGTIHSELYTKPISKPIHVLLMCLLFSMPGICKQMYTKMIDVFRKSNSDQ